MSDASLAYVLFAYGLTLFAMGVAIALEIRHDSTLALTRALPWLAGFGFVHSGVEWLAMFQIMVRAGADLPTSDVFPVWRLVLLVVSGFLLNQFGASLLAASMPKARAVRWLPIVLVLAWLGLWLLLTWPLDRADSMRVGTVTARYVLYLPGALLSGLALLSQRRSFRSLGLPRVGSACAWGTAAFILKGLSAGLVVPAALFFPASVLNYNSFRALTGVPSEVFRAVAAVGVTYFVLRVLRLFEEQRQRELAHANHQIKRLSLQAINAQEEERKRIARDLHDDTAQLLSSLLLRLKLLDRRASTAETRSRIAQIIALTAQATEGVRRMAFQLRPAALEDLGLAAAIRWYSKEIAEPRGLIVQMGGPGLRDRLPAEVELALYRVAQEALTNVAKHSGVCQATVTLSQTDAMVQLSIEDNGCGFDVKQVASSKDRGLGLFGMKERLSLLGGICQIDSRPKSGTRITVEVPATRGVGAT